MECDGFFLLPKGKPCGGKVLLHDRGPSCTKKIHHIPLMLFMDYFAVREKIVQLHEPKRRVVITGFGVITPCGNGWESLGCRTSRRSAIRSAGALNLHSPDFKICRNAAAI